MSAPGVGLLEGHAVLSLPRPAHWDSCCLSFTHGVCLTTICARLAKAAVAPVSLIVCCSLHAQLARTAVAPVFAHGVFAALVRWLTKVAIVLVLLIVCLPPFRVRLAGMGVAPVFAHSVFPPFCALLARTGIALVSLVVYSPFSCAARRDGCCSGFTHNVGPFMRCSQCRLLLRFRSWCVFPLSCTGSPGRPLLQSC